MFWFYDEIKLIGGFVICGINRKCSFLIVFGLLLPSKSFAATFAAPLNVKDVLILAEDYSPDLRAARQREIEAEKNIHIQEAYLYPTLDAGGVATTGFPGFNNQMSISGPGYNNDLGAQGMYASPYTETPAGGLTSQLDVVDLKIPYRIKQAKALYQAEKARTEIIRYKVDWDALKFYFHSVRDIGLQKVWDEILKVKTDPVYHKVVYFVNRGQHNMADELLIHDMVEEAQLNKEAYQALYGQAIEKLGIYIGKDSEDLAALDPSALSQDVLTVLTSTSVSAYISQAEFHSTSAHEFLSSRKAENYPRVTAKASVGGATGSRLVGSEDYAAGVGVSVPIFEGFGIESRIEQARARAKEKDEAVDSLKLFVAVANKTYDERIAYDSAQLKYLDEELKTDKDAYQVSLHRYVTYVGSLVDVREAIRDLERVETQIIDDKTDLLLALTSKAILNGSAVRR